MNQQNINQNRTNPQQKDRLEQEPTRAKDPSKKVPNQPGSFTDKDSSSSDRGRMQ